jgi:hypothetical protein
VWGRTVSGDITTLPRSFRELAATPVGGAAQANVNGAG